MDKKNLRIGLALGAAAVIACSEGYRQSDSSRPASHNAAAPVAKRAPIPTPTTAPAATPTPEPVTGLGKIFADFEERNALRFEVGQDLLALDGAPGTLTPVLRIDTSGDGEIDTRLFGRVYGNQAIIEADDQTETALATTRWQIGLLHDGKYVASADSSEAQLEGDLVAEAPEITVPVVPVLIDTDLDMAAESEKPGLARRVVTAPVRGAKAVGRGLGKLWPF